MVLQGGDPLKPCPLFPLWVVMCTTQRKGVEWKNHLFSRINLILERASGVGVVELMVDPWNPEAVPEKEKDENVAVEDEGMVYGMWFLMMFEPHYCKYTS